jgi:hypothetical protein
MNPIERERIARREAAALLREGIKATIGGASLASLGWLIIHILFSV